MTTIHIKPTPLQNKMLRKQKVITNAKECRDFAIFHNKKGRQEMLKEVKELIDGRKIECNMAFGEWWVNLKQLRFNLEVLGK